MRWAGWLQFNHQIIQSMRHGSHGPFEWHFIERIDDLSILSICLQSNDDEAGDADALEEGFALCLDF